MSKSFHEEDTEVIPSEQEPLPKGPDKFSKAWDFMLDRGFPWIRKKLLSLVKFVVAVVAFTPTALRGAAHVYGAPIQDAGSPAVTVAYISATSLVISLGIINLLLTYLII